jgi:hypothetical protein
LVRLLFLKAGSADALAVVLRPGEEEARRLLALNQGLGLALQDQVHCCRFSKTSAHRANSVASRVSGVMIRLWLVTA